MLVYGMKLTPRFKVGDKVLFKNKAIFEIVAVNNHEEPFGNQMYVYNLHTGVSVIRAMDYIVMIDANSILWINYNGIWENLNN